MFYERLKKICKEKGVRVTPLVLECGGTKGMLSGWKNGASPNIEIIAKIAKRLNVSTDLLIFENDLFEDDFFEDDFFEDDLLENDLKNLSESVTPSKAVNHTTYGNINSTINSFTGDYVHQGNTIKSDPTGIRVSDAAIEYENILKSLCDNDRELFVKQVRLLATSFKKKRNE